MDGYFAKKKYSDEVVDLKLHPMTKLRCDANCLFLYTGPPPQRRGPKRKDDGTGKPLWSGRPHHELARLSRALGVPYLDSFGKLSGRIKGTPRSRYYYQGDMHFNPRGYEIWAQAQFEFLTDRKNRLLPESLFR